MTNKRTTTQSLVAFALVALPLAVSAETGAAVGAGGGRCWCRCVAGQ
jgi:hypothetical protein